MGFTSGRALPMKTVEARPVSTTHQWKSDPTWRFEERLFFGDEPTARVRDNGVEMIDPEGAGPPPLRRSGASEPAVDQPGTGSVLPSTAPAAAASASTGAPTSGVPAVPPARSISAGSLDLLDDLLAKPAPVAAVSRVVAAPEPPVAAPAPTRAGSRPRANRPPAVQPIEDNDPGRLRARLLGAAAGGVPLAPKSALARPYATPQTAFEDVDVEPSIALDLFARDTNVAPPMRSAGRADGRPTRPAHHSQRARRRARLLARAVLLLALVGTLASVISVQWKKRQADAHGSWAKVWDPRVLPLAQFVERARGGPFLHPVTVRFLDDAAFTKALGAPGAEAPARGAAVLAVLGLDEAVTPGSTDETGAATTPPTGAGSRQVVGAYSPTSRRITVRGSVLTGEVRVTLVHELTHAWQDQHIGLERLTDGAYTEGERTGLQVVVEGDAELVAQAYAASLPEPAGVAAPSTMPVLPTGRSALSVAHDRLAYELGPIFMAYVIQHGGPDARDAVFDRLPRSDAEVLDPAAYLGGMTVLNVAPPAIDTSDTVLAGSPPSAVGVLAWYTLLSSRIEPRAAFAAVHGWLGDSAVAFTRADSICARATIVTAGPDAQARFADALLDWTKQSAADSAKVVRTGNNVELTVCSGGQKVTAVGNELDLFVLRNAATAAAATDRDVTVARCETESLIAITNRNDIAALHDPAVAGPKLQEMAARCTA